MNCILVIWGGDGTIDPDSALHRTLKRQFGDFSRWKADFIAAGSIRGIGWAILTFDPEGEKFMNVWINEHDLGHLAGTKPLLIMDVFEHAYMPQYGLNRAGYIDAFFKNIDWKVVEERFNSSSELSEPAERGASRRLQPLK